jgi:hypothetical protein
MVLMFEPSLSRDEIISAAKVFVRPLRERLETLGIRRSRDREGSPDAGGADRNMRIVDNEIQAILWAAADAIAATVKGGVITRHVVTLEDFYYVRRDIME